jgi:hypothetical protein
VEERKRRYTITHEEVSRSLVLRTVKGAYTSTFPRAKGFCEAEVEGIEEHSK